MTEDFIGFERQEQMWADLFNRIADDLKGFEKEWAEKRDYVNANRCSIMAETYAIVASRLTQSRRIRLEDKGY